MDAQDKQHIIKARKNPEAFVQLYRKYAKQVYNYFWYRVNHNRTIAEDLTQETFLRAFQHLSRFRIQQSSYLNYLLTIAHNILANHYRATPPIPLEEAERIPSELHTLLDRRLDLQGIWKTIQTLPENEKSALLFRYRRDLSIREIATIMGKTPNAVKILLSRARRRLKDHPKLKQIAVLKDQSKPYTQPRFSR